MTSTLERIQRLILEGNIRISEPGYDELASDGILAHEVIRGINHAIVIEDYPDYHKEPCVLVLERDRDNQPIHAIPKGQRQPAVPITRTGPIPIYGEEAVKKRTPTKLIHEGKSVLEVDVELVETDEDGSSYLSLEDAYKLDNVREALRRDDIQTAAQHGRIYTLTPVSD